MTFNFILLYIFLTASITITSLKQLRLAEILLSQSNPYHLLQRWYLQVLVKYFWRQSNFGHIVTLADDVIIRNDNVLAPNAL